MNTRNEIIKIFAGLTLAASVLLPGALQAQPIIAAHYPAGAEGLKGASLPPPGIYFRDYNFFYYSDKYKDGPPDLNLFAYINAPRLIWMTDLNILGGTYGMDVIVPFGYMDWKYQTPGGKVKDCYFGLGDIEIEPVLLSWHFKQLDLSAGYAIWAPTGDFSTSRPDIFIQGFWSHMLTLGATWYPDQEKTIALSLLNRYEFCHEQEDTHIDPGQVYTLEAGLSKTVSKGVDIGVIGYYQQQTTEDSGANAFGGLDRKFGLGPEISAFCTKLGVNTSLRYAYEFEANERPEGHLVTLTFTKRF